MLVVFLYHIHKGTMSFFLFSDFGFSVEYQMNEYGNFATPLMHCMIIVKERTAGIFSLGVLSDSVFDSSRQA